MGVTVGRNTALRRKLKTTKIWTVRIVVSPAIEVFIDKKHVGERFIFMSKKGSGSSKGHTFNTRPTCHIVSLQESEPEPPEPPPSLQDILEVGTILGTILEAHADDVI